ncbi:hypothetical protein D3C75_1273540 [compost metagenome]
MFFVDFLRQLSAFRKTDVFTFKSVIVELKVSWKMCAVFQSFFNRRKAAASFTKTNYIAKAYAVRSDIHFFAVNSYVTVGY